MTSSSIPLIPAAASTAGMKSVAGKARAFVLACAVCFGAQAAVFNVRDFGAKGDGVAKDTAAIQRAVDAAEKAGGGEVFLDVGTYLSGTVYLKDNIDFHLGPGATLLGSTVEADYNRWDFCPQNWKSEAENVSGGHLVVAVGRRNVTLRGPGRIDGNARFFATGPDGKGYRWMADIPWRPGQMVFLTECADVRIADLELADAPYWSCFVYCCNRVFVRGLYVHTLREPYSHNGDGLDIDSCQHVTVSDCNIRTSDDSITIRADAKRLPHPQDCAYVTVANCNLSSDTCAVRIGVGDGRIHDIVIRGLTVSDSRTALSFCPNWTKEGGSVSIENVRCSDIAVDCKSFCRMIVRYAKGVALKGLHFDGISGKVTEPACLFGRTSCPIEDVTFRDVDVPLGVEAYKVKDLTIEGGTLRRLELTPEREDEIRRMEENPGEYPHT